MNVNKSINFDDLLAEPMPPEMKKIVEKLVDRMDTFANSLVSQLRAEPTVFNFDPANAERVEGAKPGDIAIYVDNAGNIQVEVLG